MEKLPAKTDGRLFVYKNAFVCNQKDKDTGVQLVFKGLFKGF